MCEYKSYLRIGEKEFSIAEVIEKLVGAADANTKVALCQTVPAGVLVARASGSGDPYPSIDVDMELPVSACTTPFPVAKIEQAVNEADEGEGSGVPGPLTTFLYGRGDDYIAFSQMDTRPDEQVDEEPHNPILVASGGNDELSLLKLYIEHRVIHMPGDPPLA